MAPHNAIARDCDLLHASPNKSPSAAAATICRRFRQVIQRRSDGLLRATLDIILRWPESNQVSTHFSERLGRKVCERMTPRGVV